MNRLEQEQDYIRTQIANGELDSDIASWMDAAALVKIVRALTADDSELELSRCASELLDFRAGMVSYVEYLANERVR
jgi:hypothetical protein